MHFADSGYGSIAQIAQRLRFYGFLQRTDRVPAGEFLYFPLMLRPDLGSLVRATLQLRELVDGRCRTPHVPKRDVMLVVKSVQA